MTLDGVGKKLDKGGIGLGAVTLLQSSPHTWYTCIWSTDVRSTRMYGHFLASPNHRNLILISNPDIRSSRLYGQFSLDKTLILQAGLTVMDNATALFQVSLYSSNLVRIDFE